MPAIKLEQFGGMLPAWDPRLLPTGQAALAQNGYLFSGSLNGWRKPKVLRTLDNAAARFAYRIPVVSKTQARAYLVALGAPSPGETVSVGDLTYTWRSILIDGGEPMEVLIGATIAAGLLNLAHALTADSGENTNAGVQYGTNTPLNQEVKHFLPDTDPITGLTDPQVGVETIAGSDYNYLVIGAEDFGAAFNSISVSSSNASHVRWLYDLVDLSHNTLTYAGGTNPTFVNDVTGSAKWIEFSDPDTNVFKSPIVDDQFNRFYSSSPSQMPKYNTYDRILADDDFWLLGVPPPGCAVTLEVSGGGNDLQLGNTSGTGVTVGGNANFIYVMQITPAGDNQIQDVEFVLSATDTPTDGYTTARYAAVLFDDNAGKPGTLLNTGKIMTGAVSTAPNTSAFINPTNLSNNVPYWIGIMTDTDMAFDGGPASATPVLNFDSWSNTFNNGPPAVAPAVINQNQPGMHLYADLLTSDVIESRAYVYTWVSEYGEEGPPSPPTLLDGWSNGVWTLGLWQPPPNDLGILRNLKKINLYRTVPGQGGATVFFFVEALDIGTDVFVDTKPNSEVALNDQLTSTTWFPPPENLEGFTVMQNGMIAAFTGNEIWFCEPYHPHAWPPGYVLTVDFPIVGLGVTNGALVVCTGANPYVLTGSAPSSMGQNKCAVANPCSSRGSILSGDGAVTYMSPNGLIQVTASGVATNTTDLWFTREKWTSLVPQHDQRAIYLTSAYFCFGSVSRDLTDSSVAQRGFTIELDQDNTSFSIWPQPGGHRLGLQPLTAPTEHDIQGVFVDPWTAIGLLISDGKVWYYDFTDQLPEPQVYVWRSKLYQQNAKRNYSAMKVFFADVQPLLPTLNATRVEEDADDAVWDTLPDDRWGYIKTFADIDNNGVLELVDCREIRTSGELLRIVGGFKADCWQWEITARVAISNFQVATSVKELAQV